MLEQTIGRWFDEATLKGVNQGMEKGLQKGMHSGLAHALALAGAAALWQRARLG